MAWLLVGASLSVSESLDLPGFSHIAISNVFREWSEKKKTSSEQQKMPGRCERSQENSETVCRRTSLNIYNTSIHEADGQQTAEDLSSQLTAGN